ncbi:MULTISPECIES: hypothetical protein [unclassified Flavobacterium]|jgi:hypothetical protein|uniref:hypothetical protein n=1 Tax=unclassified Flavobacterium TaxID=196869 RepID=UPI0025C0904F|nr:MULTISPECIES: hypothetical protein [unclassified Flavobacterium]
MKKNLFVLFLIIGNSLYSQNYYFKQKDEFIQYTNSKGVFTTKLEKTIYGDYKMAFEIGNSNGKRIPLFTEYNNNVDMGYYALLEQKNSQEQKGKIYEVYSYYSTDSSGEVTVLFSTDKLSLVIFKNGKMTEYK